MARCDLQRLARRPKADTKTHAVMVRPEFDQCAFDQCAAWERAAGG